MKIRPTMYLLLLILAMSVTLAMVAPTRAQAGDMPLQVRFGSRPHWVGVPGTQVRYVRQGDRTDYDVFQYGRSYYAYNNANGRWYMSRRSQGRFFMIDDRSVPRELRRVPRDNWRNYPASWEDQYGQGQRGRLRVSFGSAPQWYGVRGTRVETVPVGERPNYDVFRYDNTYYAYENNRWYSSSRESGDFIMIDERSVPAELSRVPRDEWRDYPASWQGQNQRNRYRNGR